MGTYNIASTPLSEIIYGFGKDTSVNSFNTSVIDANLKIDDCSAMAVPKDPSTMPFSNVQYAGYKVGGSGLWFEQFAQNGRFIVDNVPKVVKSYNRSYSSDTHIPVYYQAGESGLFGHTGKLFIGGTRSSDIVSNSCPPVILFAFQACGGNSGRNLIYNKYEPGTIKEGPDIFAGGGGGGAGAFMCFQVDTQNYGSSPELLFKYMISNGAIFIFNKSGIAVASLNGGGNGEDAVITNNTFGSWGNGGIKGKGTIFTLPSNFKLVFDNTNQSGNYGNGGRGGLFNRISNNYSATEAGKDSNCSFFINSRTDSKSKISGYSGMPSTMYAPAWVFTTGGGGGAVLGGLSGTGTGFGIGTGGSYGVGYGGTGSDYGDLSVGMGGDHAVVVYW